MRGQDFTWIAEVENRNAHDVLEYRVSQKVLPFEKGIKY